MAKIIKQPDGKLLVARQRGGRITTIHCNLHILQAKQLVMDMHIKGHSEARIIAAIREALADPGTSWKDFLEKYESMHGLAAAMRLAEKVGDSNAMDTFR